MNYTERYHVLEPRFVLGKDSYLADSDVSVRFFPFQSEFRPLLLHTSDESIGENATFMYPVFYPGRPGKSKKAIVLLHGLNERRWNKYLPWAEYLCRQTGRPVILFPIAFHMNRAPYAWSNPREMDGLLQIRRQRNGEDRFLSVANVALSERICEQPLRFYVSGKQSLMDLDKLFIQIKQGNHPLFEANAHIDVFAYSIGAFLSQIAFMTNDKGLFADSKLFMFCGGSIFSAMSGKSRSILDDNAFDVLQKYYLDTFPNILFSTEHQDRVSYAFCSMIAPQWYEKERLNFFENMGNRLRGVSLNKDTVIPRQGIAQAIGADYTNQHIRPLDFDFAYSHETPFPVDGKVEPALVDTAFQQVFDEAVQFLAS